MKLLKDLKDEILANNIEKLYVFYGEDFGLRKHYINKLSESFQNVQQLDNLEQLDVSSSKGGLFTITTLYIIYGDTEFLKHSAEEVQAIIDKLKDCCVVMDYENVDENLSLYKDYPSLFTKFSTVSESIGLEFVDDIINIQHRLGKELVSNCSNNYANILLETDKIINYAQNKNVSDDNAYNSLKTKEQLLQKPPEFDINYIMDVILKRDSQQLSNVYSLVKQYYSDNLWYSLNRIFNDFLIAFCLKAYGYYEGSTVAYNLGLPWHRTKTIREFNLSESSSYYLWCADEITQIDFKVKQGKLQIPDIIDYIVYSIL